MKGARMYNSDLSKGAFTEFHNLYRKFPIFWIPRHPTNDNNLNIFNNLKKQIIFHLKACNKSFLYIYKLFWCVLMHHWDIYSLIIGLLTRLPQKWTTLKSNILKNCNFPSDQAQILKNKNRLTFWLGRMPWLFGVWLGWRPKVSKFQKLKMVFRHWKFFSLDFFNFLKIFRFFQYNNR